MERITTNSRRKKIQRARTGSFRLLRGWSWVQQRTRYSRSANHYWPPADSRYSDENIRKIIGGTVMRVLDASQR